MDKDKANKDSYNNRLQIKTKTKKSGEDATVKGKVQRNEQDTDKGDLGKKEKTKDQNKD
jgi:hypothetical protein